MKWTTFKDECIKRIGDGRLSFSDDGIWTNSWYASNDLLREIGILQNVGSLIGKTIGCDPGEMAYSQGIAIVRENCVPKGPWEDGGDRIVNAWVYDTSHIDRYGGISRYLVLEKEDEERSLMMMDHYLVMSLFTAYACDVYATQYVLWAYRDERLYWAMAGKLISDELCDTVESEMSTLIDMLTVLRNG